MSRHDSLSVELRKQVNRRLSLNLLIQGAATHVFITAHHLVANELNELNPLLVPAYDQLMPRAHLGYFHGGIPLIFGSPKRFWRSLSKPKHPFFFHPFLRKYGPHLAGKARENITTRCRQVGIPINGLANEIGASRAYLSVINLEDSHRNELVEIAVRVCQEIYGIEKSQIIAELTNTPAWGKVRRPKTLRGRAILKFMVGWGGVDRCNGQLKVRAKAHVWPLLVHELIKGTVELICLHGLSELDDSVFRSVMDETEHIEHEVPMIQIGGEFFRSFLAVLPREVPLATCVMYVAKFPPEKLDYFLEQMIESPNRATDCIRHAIP